MKKYLGVARTPTKPSQVRKALNFVAVDALIIASMSVASQAWAGD